MVLQICPQCGAPFQPAATSETTVAICPFCQSQQMAPPTRGPEPPPPVPPQPANNAPIEEDVLTIWWHIISRPLKTLEDESLQKRKVSQLFLWAILATLLGNGVMLLWSVPLGELFGGNASSTFDLRLGKLTATPFVIAIALYVETLWISFGLWMTGFFKETTLATTFRIACLAQVGTMLAAIPVFGVFIAGISNVVILFAGMTRFYKVSTFRAYLALVLPALALLVIGGIIAGVFGVFMSLIIRILNQVLFPSSPLPF